MWQQRWGYINIYAPMTKFLSSPRQEASHLKSPELRALSPPMLKSKRDYSESAKILGRIRSS